MYCIVINTCLKYVNVFENRAWHCQTGGWTLLVSKTIAFQIAVDLEHGQQSIETINLHLWNNA